MPVAKNTGGGVPGAEASAWMRSGAGMARVGREKGVTGMNIESWRSSVARVGGEGVRAGTGVAPWQPRRRGRAGGLTWGFQAVVKGMTLAALCWDAEPALRFHHGAASLQGIIAPVGSLGGAL